MGEKFEWFVDAVDMQDAIEWFCEAHSADGYKKQRDRSNYRVTVERIEPPQEQPQWWYQAYPIGTWVNHPANKGRIVEAYSDGTYGVCVYGTSLDRDAKRDALLDAAKAAGKGGE